MTNSTSTLLQVVNKCLLNIGERQVTALTSPIALQAQNSVEEAIREIENLDDWSWLRQEVNATSWDNEVATLPTFTRIHEVYYSYENTKKILQHLNRTSWLIRTTYDSFDETSQDVPRYYFIHNDSTVSVLPYPTTEASRNAINFVVSSSIVFPTSPSSVFPIPERFITLVVKLASYNLAVRHLDDTRLAANFRSEFEAMLIMLRNRGNLVPTSGTNMYRQRTRRDRML